MKKCPLNKIFCWLLWEARRLLLQLCTVLILILQHSLYIYLQNHSALSPGSLDIIKMFHWLQFWFYLCPGLLHSCPFKVLLWPVIAPLGPNPKSLWLVNTIFPLRRMSLCQQRCWKPSVRSRPSALQESPGMLLNCRATQPFHPGGE